MQVGMEGALMALSPLPFVFILIGMGSDLPPFWRLLCACFAAVTCFICAFTLFRWLRVGKALGGFSVLGSFAAVLPYLATNPSAALLGIVTLIIAGFTLMDLKPHVDPDKNNNTINRCQQRTRWAILMIPFIVSISMMFGIIDSLFSRAIIAGTSAIAQLLFIQWAWK